MSGDNYIVVPLPVRMRGAVDKYEQRHKPIVITYLPVEILNKAGWDEHTNLVLSVEKGILKITQNESGEETFFTNELIYEPFDE